jgi:hypothetical protein
MSDPVESCILFFPTGQVVCNTWNYTPDTVTMYVLITKLDYM